MTRISRPTDRRPGFLNSAPTFDLRTRPLVNAGLALVYRHPGSNINCRATSISVNALVLSGLAGTTTKATAKRSVTVAGRSSPRPRNWSGRPVRSIPITKKHDDFLRRSSCTAITVGRDGRIRHFINCQTPAISKADLHAVEGTSIALPRRFSLSKPLF
jgi:hypothetical protein